MYLNEILAAQASLALWVGYFAYLRVEMFVGIFGTMIPLGLVAAFTGQLDK